MTQCQPESGAGGKQCFLIPQRSEGDRATSGWGQEQGPRSHQLCTPTPVFPGPGCRLTQPSNHDYSSTAVPQASEEGRRVVSQPPSGIVSTGRVCMDSSHLPEPRENSLSPC